ncbi:GLUT4 regulating protein TUG-domain-containing protein [Daldinia caldariorum]|uniref:GLUT4 regulating protein TUG-domain-containing protein n=1 Tax=Daldinia caldariorum TaxID=326644 RepID=UPI002007D3F8|nr:GLUT4 regulating protein TUG-domain-containing protein [Daldinia caldariorum]KAI1466755.1 GLUT4 regulating protein TUG-domain-containing protein [Daldinia caldariorum]
MATNVKVVGTDLKQVTIKVNPGTYLTDVLEQACEKLKVPSDRYLFKYKQKQLDLSQTFRTSGLPPGAKLELIVRSNTPSAINVALQFPPPESNLFPPSGRVTEKLPSDLTIWQLLRQFESGKSSQGKNLNITGRGVAQTNNGAAAGSGQLYYETPVLTIENRTLSTFADFQKTLSQLGYNSGGVLIRLSFQKTDKTLVDAMGEINQFFKTGDANQQKAQESNSEPTTNTEVAPSADAPPSESATGAPLADKQEADEPKTAQNESTDSSSAAQPPQTDAMDVDPPSSDNRPVTIFSAPASGTPAAALRDESDDAFAPRIEHAQAHQRLLKTAGENKRLLSDKELEEKAAAQAARVAAVKSIKIRVRFPDNFSAEWPFGPDDTGATLYSEIRKIMANDAAPFKLVLPPGKTAIRDDSSPASRLIGGYRLSSNTLVNFMWDDKVPAEIRKQPFLKNSAAGHAQKVVVPEVPEVADEEEATPSNATTNPSIPASKPRGDGDGSGFKKPKWLKGFGKK